eukprot:1676537-Prymnesium_polylepis.1
MLKGEKEKAHDGEICSVDVSADGAKIVSGGRDKAIKVWDAGEQLPTATPVPKLTEATLDRHSGAQSEQRERAHRH